MDKPGWMAIVVFVGGLGMVGLSFAPALSMRSSEQALLVGFLAIGIGLVCGMVCGWTQRGICRRTKKEHKA